MLRLDLKPLNGPISTYYRIVPYGAYLSTCIWAAGCFSGQAQIYPSIYKIELHKLLPYKPGAKVLHHQERNAHIYGKMFFSPPFSVHIKSVFKAIVDEDMRHGAENDVKGAPGFFINGLFVSGAQPFEKFKEIIDRELKRLGLPEVKVAPATLPTTARPQAPQPKPAMQK